LIFETASLGMLWVLCCSLQKIRAVATNHLSRSFSAEEVTRSVPPCFALRRRWHLRQWRTRISVCRFKVKRSLYNLLQPQKLCSLSHMVFMLFVWALQ